MNITDIARIAHDANRAYCISIGDLTQLPWAQAADWQRESAIAGVRAHLAYDLTPEQSHEAWMKHKAAEGWVYGAVKDPIAKRHPCMLAYHLLPVQQRVKDALFRNIVHALKEVLVPDLPNTAAAPASTAPSDEVALETDIAAKGLNAPRLRPKDIDAVIVGETFTLLPSQRVLVCEVTLRNGFSVRGESAVISAENFDMDIGRRVARDNARSKIWELEGYLLMQRLHEAKRPVAQVTAPAGIDAGKVGAVGG